MVNSFALTELSELYKMLFRIYNRIRAVLIIDSEKCARFLRLLYANGNAIYSIISLTVEYCTYLYVSKQQPPLDLWGGGGGYKVDHKKTKKIGYVVE